MCSCDVYSLNLGLCFAVSGSGQLWWLSQCQLFRACLDCLHDFCFQLCSAVLTSFDFLFALNLFYLVWVWFLLEFWKVTQLNFLSFGICHFHPLWLILCDARIQPYPGCRGNVREETKSNECQVLFECLMHMLVLQKCLAAFVSWLLG